MSMSLEHHVHAPRSNSGKTSSSDPSGPPPPLVTNRNHAVSPSTLPTEGLETPEHFTSVPNPFALTPVPNAVSASSMASVNCGSPSSSPDPPVTNSAAPLMVPTFPPSSSGGPVIIAASGIRVPGTHDPSSSPVGSPGMNTSAPAPSRRSKSSSSPPEEEQETDGGGNTNRRQKRLERNRESARLSRRRRKQYLEVLEERVNQLSFEMDKGRREHVASAISTLQEKRFHALKTHSLAALETTLSRTNSELRVAGTFQTQQLQSLAFPPHVKFLLWLSLQTDTFFRGGRAASERLSAARIGERMLGSGNNRVPPAHGLWPLFCNEVGLSYDQEERVRSIQRMIVQTPETWVDRHTGFASGLVMESTHDCMQALHNRIGERERVVMSVLSDAQRLRLLQWAAAKRDQLHCLKAGTKEENDGYSLSPKYHVAANLYIVNHRLQKALNKLPTPPALVVGAAVKRLSRRPSFESLGSAGMLNEKGENRGLSRESSFASSGSLKRSASEMSLDEERAPSQSVSPGEAEVVAKPTVDAALGLVKDLVPFRPQPKAEHVASFAVPPVASKTPMSGPIPSHVPHQPYQPPRHAMHPPPQPVTSAPIAYGTMQQPPQDQQQQPVAPSFLPQPLNAVPEEGCLAQQGSDPADEFLFELAEEDWAIGEGFDMDAT